MTATGWTFDELNESQACDVLALLASWVEEPPTHVSLAAIAHFLGVGAVVKPKIDADQARNDMAEMGKMFQQQARPLPPHLKELVRGAEELKRCRKGLRK